MAACYWLVIEHIYITTCEESIYILHLPIEPIFTVHEPYKWINSLTYIRLPKCFQWSFVKLLYMVACYWIVIYITTCEESIYITIYTPIRILNWFYYISHPNESIHQHESEVNALWGKKREWIFLLNMFCHYQIIWLSICMYHTLLVKI